MTDIESIQDIRLRSKDWFIVGFIHSDKNVSKVMQLEPIIGENKELKELKFNKSSDRPDKVNGIYKDIKFNGIRELGEFITNEVTPNDVFVSGLAGYDEVTCYNPSNKHKAQASGDLPDKYIMRNEKFIHWADVPGLLMIDIDEYKGRYIGQEKALELVYEAIPELRNAPTLIKPSTSSFIKYKGDSKIVDSNGEDIDKENVTGKSGIRMYFVISSLKWLNKAKDFLDTRFWNSGTGYMDYTANGSEYPKCLIDLSVYNSSARLDFIKAGFEPNYGYVSDGLYQDFPEFVYINEDKEPLDVGIFFKDVSKEEKADYLELINIERNKIVNKTRQKLIVASHEENRVNQAIRDRSSIERSKGRELSDTERSVIKKNTIKSIRSMRNKGFIDEFYPIYIMNDENQVEIISIKDIYEEGLSWKNKYNGKTCASIIDPYYFPGKIYGRIEVGGESEGGILESNGAGIDFGRARIWCNDKQFYIIDQSHGGSTLFFDTEWLYVKKMKIKRLDTEEIEIPKYNLTKIANCFINQYLVGNKGDINIFGNVLKQLNNPYVKDVFCIMVNSKNSEEIWEKLDGIGPSLYEFMGKNKDTKEDVDLDNDKLLAVNKLDVKHKCFLLRQTYTKIMYSTKCLYAKKKYNFEDGWYYDFVEEGELKKFLKAHKIYQYYPNAKESTKSIKLFNFWDEVELNSYSELEFYPTANDIACKQDVIKARRKSSFNTYCGLNLVPEKSKYDLFVTPYSKEWEKDKDGNDVFLPLLDDDGIVVRKNEKIQYSDERVEILVPKDPVLTNVGGSHLLNEHIFKIMCGGVDEKYEYLLNWYARMLQFPNEQGGSVIAFQGAQGAGKNTLSDVLCKILGYSALDVANGNLIFGNFNFILADKVYVNFNEAIFSGDRKGQAQFKTMTTESHIVINRKNKDEIKIKNTLHLSLISNHEALAPMDAGDRRLAMFDVIDKKVGDTKYFNRVHKEINRGGAEHFAYELLNRDITGFRSSDLPKSTSSNAALNSILNFGDLWQQWWYECLIDNELYGAEWDSLGSNPKLEEFMEFSSSGLGDYSGIPTSLLFSAYHNWRESSGQNRGAITQNRLTRLLINVSSGKKLIRWGGVSNEGKSLAKNCNCLLFNNLDKARNMLEYYMKQRINWE